MEDKQVVICKTCNRPERDPAMPNDYSVCPRMHSQFTGDYAHNIKCCLEIGVAWRDERLANLQPELPPERRPAEGKQVAMIRGLVRAAEGLEQRDNANRTTTPGGGIWDDSSRVGLEIAREFGWGKDQVGTLPLPPRTTFCTELQQLINQHSQENGSQTPDFILASYLQSCLDAWNLHTRERDRWFGNRSLRGPGVDDGAFPPVPASERSLLP